MAPVQAYLADHPRDFIGAQAILLSKIVGFPVAVDDPAFAGARANAEPMILDEPTITLQRFEPESFAGLDVTVASGRKHTVLARHVRNRRLYDAIDKWAFSSLRSSPGCRSYYDQRRATGDLHHQALRALGNRLVGILHGCLRYGVIYDEAVAWEHRIEKAA